mmetsp:Transcript_79700/g.110740  ORF Transcript_79700/g.110740 Transcript_79700/m.110740 type:complete len:110 (+) Transcript_79700:557-886(+)
MAGYHQAGFLVFMKLYFHYIQTAHFSEHSNIRIDRPTAMHHHNNILLKAKEEGLLLSYDSNNNDVDRDDTTAEGDHPSPVMVKENVAGTTNNFKPVVIVQPETPILFTP